MPKRTITPPARAAARSGVTAELPRLIGMELLSVVDVNCELKPASALAVSRPCRDPEAEREISLYPRIYYHLAARGFILN
jgi:hypothetical protein